MIWCLIVCLYPINVKMSGLTIFCFFFALQRIQRENVHNCNRCRSLIGGIHMKKYERILNTQIYKNQTRMMSNNNFSSKKRMV